jgi:hypothetical protein
LPANLRGARGRWNDGSGIANLMLAILRNRLMNAFVTRSPSR